MLPFTPGGFCRMERSRKVHLGTSGLIGVLGFAVLTMTPLERNRSTTLATPLAKSASVELPLTFEPNRGQVASKAQFFARGAGYRIDVTPAGVALHFRNSADILEMKIMGGNEST